MENANKAVIMAFGMIVASLIIMLIVLVFRRLSNLPSEDYIKEEAEQLHKFNEAYEVYDKSIMYGADVVSVLNKALSNNEKYVGEKFLSGVKYPDEYVIEMEVKINTALIEKFEVTYLQNSGSGSVEKQYTEGEGPGLPTVNNLNPAIYGDGVTSNAIFAIKYGVAFGSEEHPFQPSDSYISTVYNNNFWANENLRSQESVATKFVAKTYKLDELKDLLSVSAEMQKNVKNRRPNKYNYETDKNVGWNQATWKPAVYDLKTRKFKCTDVKYNEKTGRVNYMKFEEWTN